jgi:hypothetical protein
MHGNDLPCNRETQERGLWKGRGRSEESRLHRGYRVDATGEIADALPAKGRFLVAPGFHALPAVTWHWRKMFEVLAGATGRIGVVGLHTPSAFWIPQIY